MGQLGRSINLSDKKTWIPYKDLGHKADQLRTLCPYYGPIIFHSDGSSHEVVLSPARLGKNS